MYHLKELTRICVMVEPSTFFDKLQTLPEFVGVVELLLLGVLLLLLTMLPRLLLRRRRLPSATAIAEAWKRPGAAAAVTGH